MILSLVHGWVFPHSTLGINLLALVTSNQLIHKSILVFGKESNNYSAISFGTLFTNMHFYGGNQSKISLKILLSREIGILPGVMVSMVLLTSLSVHKIRHKFFLSADTNRKNRSQMRTPKKV